MKKLLALLWALMIAVSTFAIDFNETFGMKKQDNPADYQQYVGKSFTLRNPVGQLETWYKSGLSLSNDMMGKSYTITKVAVKDVVVNAKINRQVTVVAVQNGTKKKIKFKAYEEVAVTGALYVRALPLIGYMPIVFDEPMNEFKKQVVGTMLTNPKVKESYEIIDAEVVRPKNVDKPACAELGIRIKGSSTGKSYLTLYKTRDTVPWATALEGQYRTALVAVEKPEDSGKRYGVTAMVTDDGVNKYSFNDSIINIFIYGTPEMFNFELKNVSPNSLKIIWDEASFVGIDGLTSKIMHNGVKYSEKENSQPSTTIIKGAKIDDLACPTVNVYYDDFVKSWKTKSMLPEEYVGKDAGEIRLMIPIQVKEVVNEYIFVFKVYYTYDHPELLNQEAL